MNRFTKYGGWSMVLFVVIITFVVGARMDQHTISVLAGTASGFLVAAISIGGVAYFIGRKQGAQPQHPATRYVSPMPQLPPNYAVLPITFAHPQMMQASLQNATQWASANTVPPAFQIGAARKFFVIGSSGEVQELSEMEGAQGPTLF